MWGSALPAVGDYSFVAHAVAFAVGRFHACFVMGDGRVRAVGRLTRWGKPAGLVSARCWR